MAIYVSTGAFESRDINAILDIADKYDIRNIELSPGLEYNSNTVNIVKDASNSFSFLIHNYFPTPIDAFSLNLASSDSSIIKNSLEMCYKNIDLTHDLGIDHYSIHCGFCFDTSGEALGNRNQVDLPRIPFEIAKETFAENLRLVCDYAYKRSVKIAIENNVAAEFTNGADNILLGVNSDDMLELKSMIDRSNLRFLLDIAHAKVSSNTMGFDLELMIGKLMDYVVEVHISNNDGRRDQNLPFNNVTEIIGLSNITSVDIPVTLEVYNLKPTQIKDQITLVREALRSEN